MLAAKNKRKIRNDSKKHQIASKGLQSNVNNVNLVQRLSFSFYGQDTIKKRKQIIFDNCQLVSELPTPTQHIKDHPVRSQRVSEVPSRSSKSKKKKNSFLDIQNFFFEQKCDMIDLVPTTASHGDIKQRQESLPKMKIMSRPNTSKTKKNNLKINIQRRNCQTVLGKKGELKSFRKSGKVKQNRK